MLTPGIIPHTEPRLRVGIVLPQDNFTSISLITPTKYDYQIEHQGKRHTPGHSMEILFKLQQNHIEFRLDNSVFLAEEEIILKPVQEKTTLSPQDGVIVKNVISGRDFHWKKQIDVYLPGTVIIRRHEKNLLVINELPIEHYLMCVATSEMGATCPPALIEAQTIAARSWMLANVELKHIKLTMDVCNDDCCQRYQGTTFLSDQSVQGALNTYGKVLIYEDQICDARYSKSCGGVMESFDAIWGGTNPPYFQVKADAAEEPMEWIKPLSEEAHFRRWVKSRPMTFCSPWIVPEKELKKYLGSVDEEGTYFRWEEQITQEELTQNINHFHSLGAKAIVNLEVLNRGGSGRINRLAVEYLDANDEHQILLLQSDFSIRQSLHPKFLYSSALLIYPVMGESDLPELFRYQGAGWGHGAGLCQIGALGMALQNYSSEQILQHYYPGSELKKIY